MARTTKAVAASSDAPAAIPIAERILCAAFDAFTENGYSGTSILEIATRAKISKRDVYANFAGKQGVLVALIANRAERMRLPANLPAPRDRAMLAGTLIKFGTGVLREGSQPAVTAMFRCAISEAQHSPEVAETLHKARSINRDALTNLLSEAQKIGVLDAAEPRLMAEQFLALLWQDLMMDRLLGVADVPKSTEVDRKARLATEIFLKLYGTNDSRENAARSKAQ